MDINSRPTVFRDKNSIPSDSLLIDAFSSAVKELFFIENPHLKPAMPEAKESLELYLNTHGAGAIWVYYPWNGKVVKSLSEDLYFKLRTARNRNIITEEEQKKYRGAKVGIAGLSVGSAILSALVSTGGPRIIKIADFDVVEISNLNRIRAKLFDVGTNKTTVAAREAWELDPFADLYLYPDGLKKDILEEFILGEPRLDIFLDEMDNLELKFLARQICKKNKIPVVMATDNGDGVILDVERFDLEPERPIFHGLVKEEELQNLVTSDYKKWIEIANKIIGFEYLSERVKNSLLQIGKTIASVPQVGSAAMMAGAAVSYVVRQIANREPFESGKYRIGSQEKLI